ncbi:MAG: hypothetical protein PHI58_00570 [Candidatus Omnitrophica bacterium]|nr:hypothetical protein [Candidatus Omnitrophota bacterium]
MYRASRWIVSANSPRKLGLLTRYNGHAILLKSGKFLMAPEVIADDLALIRSVVHEDNEILMQQEEKLRSGRYNRLLKQILGRDDIMKLYHAISRYNGLHDRPDNIVFNDLISRAFELLYIIDEELIYPDEIFPQEREFAELMRPILETKDSIGRYKNFSKVFFDTDKRTKVIEALQEDRSARFYRVASAPVSDDADPSESDREELEEAVSDCFWSAHRLYSETREALSRLRADVADGKSLEAMNNPILNDKNWNASKNFFDARERLGDLSLAWSEKFGWPIRSTSNPVYSWYQLFSQGVTSDTFTAIFARINLIKENNRKLLTGSYGHIPDLTAENINNALVSITDDIESIFLKKSENELCAAGLILARGEVMNKWNYYDRGSDGNYKLATERLNGGRPVTLYETAGLVRRKELGGIMGETDQGKKAAKLKNFIESDKAIADRVRSARESLPFLPGNAFCVIKKDGIPTIAFDFIANAFYDYESSFTEPYFLPLPPESGMVSQEDFFKIKLTRDGLTVGDIFKKRGFGCFVEQGLPLERSIDVWYDRTGDDLIIEEEQRFDPGTIPTIEIDLRSDGEYSTGIGDMPLLKRGNESDASRDKLFRLHFHTKEEPHPSMTDVETIADDGVPGIIVTPSGRARLWFISDREKLDAARRSRHWENYKNAPMVITNPFVESFMSFVEVDLKLNPLASGLWSGEPLFPEDGSADGVKQAFDSLNTEVRSESRLNAYVSRLRGTGQNFTEAGKFRFCLPVEVLKNSPDIALALSGTALPKRLQKDAGNIEFELVVTGVADEDVGLIEGLNKDHIKNALNLPKNFTVSVISETQIRQEAGRLGCDITEPKQRVALIKDFFTGSPVDGEYTAIATDAVDSAEKADALKEELEKELGPELAEENISIRVLVRPESGKSMYSVAAILNDWLEAIGRGNFSTINKILPVSVPLSPQIERAVRAAWAALAFA